jgi:hypothetical protein
MARDYEDIDGLESLDDAELRARIVQEFEEYGDLDTDLVDVQVAEGTVTLSGRVGTESELQRFEHVVTDVLGLKDVSNLIVVDELVRQESSEAADEAAVDVMQAGGATHGGADRTEDTAEHLLVDTAAEQFGTDDVTEAIERGYSYEPPRGPTQEGTRSREEH